MSGEIRFAAGDFEVFEKIEGPARSYGRLARIDGAVRLREHPELQYIAMLEAEGASMRSEANLVVEDVPHGTFSLTSIPMALVRPYVPADVLDALPTRSLAIEATVQPDAKRTSKILVTGEGTSLTLEGGLSREAFDLTKGVFRLTPEAPALQRFLEPRVAGLTIEQAGRLNAQILPTRIPFGGVPGDLSVQVDVDRFAVARDGHRAVLAPIRAVAKKSGDALLVEDLQSTIRIDDQDVTLTGRGAVGESTTLSLNLKGESKALAVIDERLVTALGQRVDTSVDLSMAGGVTRVSVRPGATNLTTDRPLAVTLGERVTLEKPWVGALAVQPDLVHLLAPDLVLKQPTSVRTTLSKFDRGERLEAFTAQVEAADVQLGAGSADVRLRNLIVASAMKGPELLGYRIEYDESDQHTKLQGEVQLDGSQATRATIHGVAPTVPTSLVDALVGGGGMLTEALGPVVWLRVNAEDLLTGAATVSLEANSDRASAKLKAHTTDGIATLEQPLDLQVTRVTPTLTAATLTLLPLVGNVEKRADDAPARIYSDDLRFPVDLDYAKLNGRILLDPGEARFSTSTTFGRLLNLGENVVGRRLEPLMITITNGVATYDTWTVPLGEFEIQSEGSVNLVTRTVDIVTYVPLGAVSDEVAGIFNTGIGAAFPMKRTTMVPLRTKGPMGRAKTEPDVKL
ncbi:MAG: hypothetical protein KDA28_05880, partial [Phycisphaerales bacterium]|nr:hypothetical protein [Phycisphaerales bacterium]